MGSDRPQLGVRRCRSRRATVHQLAVLLGFDATTTRLVPDSTFAAGTLGDVGMATHAALIAVGWSGEQVAEALGRARHAVDVAVADNAPIPLADLGVVFRELVDGGLAVAVLTSDDRDPTLRFLDQVGVRSLVSVVITADDVDHPKPHPDGLHRVGAALGFGGERILMVGDSLADHHAARHAGAHFVAVGADAAAAVGADAAVHSVAEVRAG